MESTQRALLDWVCRDQRVIPVKLIHSLLNHLKIPGDRLWNDVDAVAGQGEFDMQPVRTRHAKPN